MEVITNIAPEAPNPPSVSDVDIVRAWRDPRYRRNLSTEQLQALPGNPAGPIDFTSNDLKAAGFWPELDAFITTAPTCTELTFHHFKACGCA